MNKSITNIALAQLILPTHQDPNPHRKAYGKVQDYDGADITALGGVMSF